MLVASAALLLSGLSFPSTAQAASPDPFPIGNSLIFVAQTGSATNNAGTQLYTAQQGGNNSVALSATGGVDPANYNAIGFDANDMYLYGIEVGSNRLVQIGQNGVTATLGAVVGLPVQGGSVTYNAGDVGEGTYSDTLFVRTSDNSAPNDTYMWLVDVTSLTAQRVTLSQAVPNTADLVWYDGYLWAFDGNNGANPRMFRIAPSGQVDLFSLPDLGIATDSYGAQWAYGNGMIGILGNQTGNLYQLIISDPTGATPTFQVFATLSGPQTSGNDGASYKGIPDDGSDTATSTPVTAPVSYTITYLFDNGGKETTLTVAPGTVTSGIGMAGDAVTPAGSAIAANQPPGASEGVAVNGPFVLSGDPTANNFIVRYTNTAPAIKAIRPVIYVQQGVVLTQDQILAIAGVSVEDEEETIPLGRVSVTGYSDIDWGTVNYPGAAAVISLETTDTPGLEAPIQQIAIYIEPYDTSIKGQNPDPDYPIDKIPDGTQVGTDLGGKPIIWIPILAQLGGQKGITGTGLQPPQQAPAATPAAASVPASALPKTSDVLSVTLPLIALAGALLCLLLAYSRRQNSGDGPG